MAFLFTGVVLIGGVADPPAARAAAPKLSQNYDLKRDRAPRVKVPKQTEEMKPL